MRPTRTHLAVLLLGFAFLGAWWTVTAQEGMRPPAPVRPPALPTPSLRIDDHPLKPRQFPPEAQDPSATPPGVVPPPLELPAAAPQPIQPPPLPMSNTPPLPPVPPAPPVAPLPMPMQNPMLTEPTLPPVLPLPMPMRTEANASPPVLPLPNTPPLPSPEKKGVDSALPVLPLPSTPPLENTQLTPDINITVTHPPALPMPHAPKKIEHAPPASDIKVLVTHPNSTPTPNAPALAQTPAQRPEHKPAAGASTTAQKVEPASTEPSDGSQVVIVIPPEELHKYRPGGKLPTKGAPTLPIIRTEGDPSTKHHAAKTPIVRVQHGEESGAPPEKNKLAPPPDEVPTFPPQLPPPNNTIDPPAFPPVLTPPSLPKQDPPAVPKQDPPSLPKQDPPAAPKQDPPVAPQKVNQIEVPTIGPSVPLQRPQPTPPTAPNTLPPLANPEHEAPKPPPPQPLRPAPKGLLIGPAEAPMAPMHDVAQQPQAPLARQGDQLLEMDVKNRLFRNGQGPTTSQPTPTPMPPPMQNRNTPAPNPVPPHNTRISTGGAPATPLLTVEKRGPAAQTTGGVVQYQIVVRNIGHYAAHQVRVVDEIPSSIRLDYSDPVPSLDNGRATWEIPTLQPGEERIFRLDLKPIRPGVVVSNASVHVSARFPFKLTVDGAPLEESFPPQPTPVETFPDNKPKKLTLPEPAPTTNNEIKGSLKVRAPETGSVGMQILFEVMVTNSGTQPLSGLKLWAKLPEGLFHKAGKEIIADLPPIAAGKTEKFDVPVTAMKMGLQRMSFRITGVPGEPWTANHEVMLIGATPTNLPLPIPQLRKGTGGLQLRVTSPTGMAANREAEIRIDVTNDHTEPLTQVQLIHALPEGMEFAAAGDLGMYQPAIRTASWVMPALAPGESKSVSLKVVPLNTGSLPLEVIAKSAQLDDVKSTQNVQIEGLTALGVRITSRDGPIEVGKETIYQVRVANDGNASATNVQVQITMPPGIQPKSFAEGPTKYQVEGSTVLFAPLPRLAPKTEMIYVVAGRALAAGDHRVRAVVISEQQPTPLIRETQTMAFQAK